MKRLLLSILATVLLSLSIRAQSQYQYGDWKIFYGEDEFGDEVRSEVSIGTELKNNTSITCCAVITNRVKINNRQQKTFVIWLQGFYTTNCGSIESIKLKRHSDGQVFQLQPQAKNENDPWVYFIDEEYNALVSVFENGGFTMSIRMNELNLNDFKTYNYKIGQTGVIGAIKTLLKWPVNSSSAGNSSSNNAETETFTVISGPKRGAKFIINAASKKLTFKNIEGKSVVYVIDNCKRTGNVWEFYMHHPTSSKKYVLTMRSNGQSTWKDVSTGKVTQYSVQ